MPLNLHMLASPLVGILIPEVELIAVRAVSAPAVELGTASMEYGDCVRLSAQKQSLSGDEMALTEGVMQGGICRKFYLSVPGEALSAGEREAQRGPSYLYETAPACWWRVYAVSEDCTDAGWQLVFAARQTRVPAAVERALAQSGLAGTPGTLRLHISGSGGFRDGDAGED